jgi:hypothetical protein
MCILAESKQKSMKEKVNNRAIYAIYGSPKELKKAEKLLVKYGFDGVLSNEGARAANFDPRSQIKYQWIIVYGAAEEYAYRFSNPTEGKKDAPPIIHTSELRKRLKRDSKVKTDVKRFKIG